jgi:hypothetical protein
VKGGEGEGEGEGEGTGKRKGEEFHDEEEWENAQNAAHTMCMHHAPCVPCISRRKEDY